MTTPYYSDDLVTLYLGDCREVTAWLSADVLVTDPPYGKRWRQQDSNGPRGWVDDSHPGIAGDESTETRDAALAAWGDRLAVAFGHLTLAPPSGTKQVLVYHKAKASGMFRITAGFRRDIEAIYLLGPWPVPFVSDGRSSVLRTGTRSQTGPASLAVRYGHPHAKPVDVMETLITACPAGIIADPFCGTGSTLVAARNLGRRVVGVEVEERYCEAAARRLAQGVLSPST